MNPGDAVIFHPTKHPRTPRPAVFVDASASRFRIKLTEPDGSTRTILVAKESVKKARDK